MSEFKVRVVRLGPIEKHPKADRLGIVMVDASADGGGYPVITNISEPDSFKPGDLAVYVPVDALVPASDPRFAFLLPEPKLEVPENATDGEILALLTKHQTRHAKWVEESRGLVRVKAKKLRGVFSMGLLVPAAPGMKEGDDVQDVLKIEKYEPDEANRKGHPTGPQAFGGGIVESCPLPVPVYTDIEGFRKYSKVIEEGEEVVITEKVHGQNARFVSDGKRLYCSSHYQWKARPRSVSGDDLRAYDKAKRLWPLFHVLFVIGRFFQNLIYEITGGRVAFHLPPEDRRPREPRDVPMSNWWDVAIRENLEERLRAVPGIVFYGEIYGPVQDLKYGSPDVIKLRVFDALDTTKGRYLDYAEFEALAQLLGLEVAPVLYRGPWKAELKSLAEGKTTLGGQHVREGFVVRPVVERHHRLLGRVILKLVGEGYLTR